MKIAIYARYSTDLQDKTSIDGQVANCESLAVRENFDVVARYHDAAQSGNDDNRPQYQQLLADSEAGLFDAIIVDETSRLTRRPGELPRLLEILAFRNQFLLDCSGFDSRQETAALLASIYGGIDSLELCKIKRRTHRGLRERAKAGFSAGGRTYGYTSEAVDPTDPDTKWRKIINQDEAEWVVWIFERYVEGLGGKRIAAELNRLQVPSPGAAWKRTTRRTDGKWQHSAILGMASRSSGILRNELYIGRVIWNRGEWIKKPGTSIRTYRPRPRDQWIIVDQPDLRIVPPELWQKVQARLNNPNAAASRPGRRGKYLLTGILKCAECGGSMTLIDRRCYGCGTRHRGGDFACSNPIRLRRTKLEDHLLAEVRQELLAPNVIRWVKREISSALNTPDNTNQYETELMSLGSEITRVVDAIAQVGISPALESKLHELEQRKVEAEIALASAQRPITLPDCSEIQEIWTELVEGLGELKDKATDMELEAARTAIKGLVGEIRVTRDGLGYADVCLQSMVAGARLLKKSIYTQSPSRLYQVHKQAGRGHQAVALDTKYWFECSPTHG